VNQEHHRITPEGKAIGEQMVRLNAKTLALAVSKGIEDERCISCAFRPGTVPNGCSQTQMDALKAVMEGVPFMCHASKPANSEYCFGWIIARAALAKSGASKTTKMPWDFSPEDGDEDRHDHE